MLIEAIGSKKRLLILKLLSRGERCVSEIMKELKMDGKTAKYHLDILERAELIGCKVIGRRKYYFLRKEVKLEISPSPYRRFILTAQDKVTSENKRYD